jgi:NADH:ubiquinone oxidoreductase subunit 6 (subunit J)
VRISGGTFGVAAVGPLVAITERWSAIDLAGDSVSGEVLATTLLAGYQSYFDLMALLIVSTMVPALLVPAISRPAER